MIRTDIVVGVDASRGSAAALAWALDDASRRGVRVRAAQLLVLGARGAGGSRALSLGSTAHRCLAQASCPTAIIRGRGH